MSIHVVDLYKEWQPTYSAYTSFKKAKKRKQQAILEMVAEAGEILGIAQKAQRKSIEIDREKVVDELGDVFWGVNAIMNEFDISYEELIDYNMNKLNARNPR